MRIETIPVKKQVKQGPAPWLEHWETHAKKKAGKCTVIGCDAPASVGAQVIKPSMGPVAYIVPLCSAHAGQEGAMEVAESTVFVLAKK